MNQLRDILKELKKIESHPNFAKTSRMQILHTPRAAHTALIPTRAWHERLLERLSSPAMVIASFIAVIALSGSLYIQHRAAPYLASLNFNTQEKDKVKEELAIQITLSELASYDRSEAMMQVALYEASGAREAKNTIAPYAAPQEDVNTPVNHNIDKALELML